MTLFSPGSGWPGSPLVGLVKVVVLGRRRAPGWAAVGVMIAAGWLGISPAPAMPFPLRLAQDTATQTQPPLVPPLPESVPAAISPNLAGIVGLHPTPEAALGVGLLRPSNLTSLQGRNWRSSPLLYANWLRSTALPIYTTPAGDLWGWLINGWLMVSGYDPIAVGQDASFWMVQADRGLYSFPVMELRSDGWFRFQYTPLGTAWSHVGYLNLGAVALSIETWEDHLRTADRIQFRKHGLSQPLRSGPQGSGRLRSLVSSHSLIRPLEVQGNWVRVQVTQPVRGCTPLPGSTTEEGWMRWRDGNQTLLIWFGTEEGCAP